MSALIHLIYTSVATQSFRPEHLGDLLETSRTNNERLGLTGMLLYSEDNFFQVLEGELAVVHQVYGKILLDSQHAQHTVIIREPIARRSFGTWSMGFVSASEAELRGLNGLNDFFQDGSCFTGLSAGRAKKLLAAFAKGRWRAKIFGQERLVA